MKATFTSSGSARWLPILLLLSFLGSSKASAQAYCPALYSTNSPVASEGIAEADFNGDGKPDLVTAHHNVTNGSPNAVSVLLNNGQGGFSSGVLYAVGGRPVSMAVGDFNGDGKPDLVTANGRANSTISVLLNNGSGGFLPKTDYAPEIYNTRVAVGDFNNDGKPDIVVRGSGGSTVKILLNNGSGGFSEATSLNLSQVFLDGAYVGPSLDLTVGDFDNNGNLDVAVGVLYTNNDGVAVKRVEVLRGKGDGTFYSTPANADVGGPAISVAGGDFNGDGYLDLATINAGVVSVNLGNMSAGYNFEARTDYAVGDNPSTVVVKDFNKDGKLDLVVANASGKSVSVLLGNGSGGFGAKTDIPLDIQIGGTITEISPVGLVVTDFNGDGKPDLATARSGAAQAFVMLNCPFAPFLGVVTADNYRICANTAVNVSANVRGGTPPYTYSWAAPAGATFTSATNTATASARLISGGQFTLTVHDAEGRSITVQSGQVVVDGLPISTLSSTLNCSQPGLTLVAGPTLVVYDRGNYLLILLVGRA